MSGAARQPIIGTTDLSQGWHEGRSMAEYLSDHAASASQLWGLYSKTPAHLAYELLEAEDDDTPARTLGSLTHTKVFEPDVFEERYVVIGRCEGRKKDGERCQYQGSVYRDGQSLCGTHDPHGKDVPMDSSIECVTKKQKGDAIGMDDALKEHPTAAEILSAPGPREVTGIAKDPSTGLWLRIRPDELIYDPPETPERYWYSCVNLKTTDRGIGPGGQFVRDFERSGHYFKAAFYRMVLRELWDIEPQNFLYPTVEASPPHQVIVYRLNEDALDIGENEVREALNTLARCVESGEWPGYGPTLYDLNLPDWRLKMAHDIDRLELAS